jgi:hypothetical protein
MERTGRFISSEKHVLGWIAIVGAGLIVIAILTSAALAEAPCQKFCILPPVEYDHPYTGKLTIETVLQREDLREFCGAAFLPWTLACARRDVTNNSCHIVIASDNLIREQRWSTELIMRHEIGHCNGWDGHHGQRPWNAK